MTKIKYCWVNLSNYIVYYKLGALIQVHVLHVYILHTPYIIYLHTHETSAQSLNMLFIMNIVHHFHQSIVQSEPVSTTVYSHLQPTAIDQQSTTVDRSRRKSSWLLTLHLISLLTAAFFSSSYLWFSPCNQTYLQNISYLFIFYFKLLIHHDDEMKRLLIQLHSNMST